MNQITQMFMESNNRMKRILKGGFKYEEIAAAQREFEGQIKLINAVVSAFGIASKNKRALSGLKNMNLMDDETAIDLLIGDPEDDKVKCPELNRLLSSHECLDYSGDHNEECAGCEIGKSVKNKLCPTRQ
jgi:hypothetical protein